MKKIFELIGIIVVGAICGLILLLASLGLYALRHPDEVIVRSNTKPPIVTSKYYAVYIYTT